MSKLDDSVGHTVVHKQGILRGSGVEGQGGGCGGASPYSWGSSRQEVSDPVTEGGPSQVTELDGHLLE